MVMVIFLFVIFLTVRVIVIALKFGVVWIMVETLGIGEDRANPFLVAAQLTAIFIVSIFNFFANSMWTFGKDMKKATAR
jgi:putative flippase GtrA